MNIHYHISTTLLTSLLIFNSGCSESSNREAKSEKAKISDSFMSKKDLGMALSVIELTENNYTGKEFIIEGFIGGRKKPFAQNSALFILGDHSLQTCDEKAKDNCPTPWDVCCEDRKKVASSTLSVQVLDSKGMLLSGTLDGVEGLEAGAHVKVKGRLDQNSQTNAFIINAKNIYLARN